MFDYLGVLLSVILGLALTHLMLGLSRMIQLRRTVRIYWVHLLWALSVLLYVLAIWWGMYWWRHLAAWRFEEFVFLAGYSILLFMLAAMLFPSESCEGVDFEAHFFDNRRWFFGMLAVALVIDFPETVSKSVAGLRAVPVQYWLFLPVALAIALTGLATANRRVHAAIAVAWLIVFTAYLTLSSLERIAAS